MTRSWIELSTSALYHNIKQVTSLINESELGVVVKGNAYGHGLIPIALLLEKHPKVAWLFTAALEEALALRQAGVTKKIVVLAYILYDKNRLQQAIEQNIHFTISSPELLENLNNIAYSCKKKAFIHLKIDTGLSRLGSLPQDTLSLAQAIAKSENLSLQALFTHLADTSNPDQAYTYHQINLFFTIEHYLRSNNIHYNHCHILASGSLMLESLCLRAAYYEEMTTAESYTINLDGSLSGYHKSGLKLSNFKATQIVRVGTMVYGHWKSGVHQQNIVAHSPLCSLKNVLTWKTIITDIKRVLYPNMVIATIPVGYAHGYPHALSHKGSVSINGTIIPVLDVNSNISTLDITNIPISFFDNPNNRQVTLIGCDPITITHIANLIGTLHNEFLCGISPQLPRHVL
ncbi:MAG TPA: alanine racemase [Candidatus Babeliaceae bacterium]|nr:alanine racemase [Candidatus Babeliaceae bacterium]